MAMSEGDGGVLCLLYCFGGPSRINPNLGSRLGCRLGDGDVGWVAWLVASDEVCRLD